MEFVQTRDWRMIDAHAAPDHALSRQLDHLRGAMRAASSGCGPVTGRVLDLSRPQFLVGNNTQPATAIQTLSGVKADPATITPITTGSSTPQQKVDLLYLDGVPTPPDYYNEGSAPTQLVSTLSNSTVELPIARLGLWFSVLQADRVAAAKHTAESALYWRIRSAAVALLRRLDLSLAQGTGGESPVPGPAGLKTGCTALGRTQATSTDLEKDVRRAVAKIAVNGSGAGIGVDALICGPKVAQLLPATASGKGGASGWRFDPRIGQMVFYYMGLPVYVTQVDEAETGSLYAVNLGEQGLNLVHTQGSFESFGFTVSIFTDPTSLLEKVVVHGAFAFAIWEPGAIWEITGIDVSGV
jgi:hypothetical protein